MLYHHHTVSKTVSNATWDKLWWKFFSYIDPCFVLATGFELDLSGCESTTPTIVPQTIPFLLVMNVAE